MAKATTIKEALARWEEKSGQKASEAKEVKLYGQVPPVEKMDGALSALVNCEKLSLSTNCIDRIANLNNLSICKAALYAASSIETKSAALKYDQNHFCLEKKSDELRKIKRSRSAIRVQVQEKLRILSLGRNNIKNLNGLEAVADTLEELWISYNLIEKLRGIRVMKKLKILYMSNNLVKDWAEFVRLAELPLLEELVFVGNPLQEKFAADQNSWIEEATKRVPNLKKLDGTLVVKEEEEEGGEGAEGAN